MIHAADSAALWTRWGGDLSSALGIAAIAAVYGAGTHAVWQHAGRGHGVQRWQVACFAGCIATLAIALLSPLDALAGDLFSAHMTQHVLLAVVAPPLLVAGAPTVAIAWAIPEGSRRRLALAIKRQRWIVASWRYVTRPFVACAIHAIALWSWHAPYLYLAALTNPFVHFLEHASFVGTAALIWWSILHPSDRTRHAAFAVGIGVLFLTALQSGVLGALLATSTRVWYPQQGTGAAAWGLTPLEDQQLAGLIMWVPAGFLYVVAMAVLFWAWMGRAERHPAAA